MTICDLCRVHTQKRNVIDGDRVIALTNLTREILRNMSLDDITNVYNKAKEGAMVCDDCLNLCKLRDQGCTSTDKQNLGAYKWRISEDRATMKAIVEELDRRINVKQLVEDLNKYR